MHKDKIESDVYQCLKDLSIDFKEYKHPPVRTVDEASRYWQAIDAMHCKNLFLRDNKGRRHFLVIMEHNKPFDIKKFGHQSNLGRLSFASKERLSKFLGLEPGSVSPFGLINDRENSVEVYVDENIKDTSHLGFHPNINTVTITISPDDFDRFLDWVGNDYSYVQF